MKTGGNLTKMVKPNTLTLAGTLLAVTMSLFFSAPVVHADEYKPYKLSMTRIEPNKPLRKSAIMAEVRKEWPGQILHIRSDRTGGEDCHIVKSMGDDGEFRIIRVACSD